MFWPPRIVSHTSVGDFVCPCVYVGALCVSLTYLRFCNSFHSNEAGGGALLNGVELL